LTSGVAGLQDVANYVVMPVHGTSNSCEAVNTSDLWHPLYPPLETECNDAMRIGVDAQLAASNTTKLADVTALDGSAHRDLGNGHCDVEWHLTAAVPNHAPVANDDTLESAPAGDSVDIPVLNNDTDEDSDALSVGSFTQPDCGTVTLAAGTPQQLSYAAPDAGCSGGTSFTYRASDGKAFSAPATVSVSADCPATGE
jgi:hypothetical protein